MGGFFLSALGLQQLSKQPALFQLSTEKGKLCSIAGQYSNTSKETHITFAPTLSVVRKTNKQ